MDFTILSILEIAPPFYLIGAVIEIDTDVGDNHVLSSPSLRFTGSIVTQDAEIINYIRQLVDTGVTKVNDNEFINQNIFLRFLETVKVTFTSEYPLKTYITYPSGRKIFVGDPPHDYQNDKAEIRYTLNGKTPKISSKLYRKKIIFNQNNSGTKDNNLRYKVFYKGKQSNSSTIKFSIIKNNRTFFELEKI